VDLTLKFDPEEFMATLGSVSDGDVIALTLAAQLGDGKVIKRQDCFVNLDKGKE
jgi:hypothetical protein